MRILTTGSIVLALGLGIVADVAAQSRVVVPIIIQRPAATPGPTETRVYLQGRTAATGTPAAPGSGMGFSTSPSSSQEIRVLTPGSPVPTSSGSASGSPGFFTSPQTTTEIRVIQPGAASGAADSAAPRSFHTSPTQTHEIRVFGGGATVETPVVILPE